MPQYDPFKHHRRSIRLADWDYRTPGYYFVTICTHQRQHLFDTVAYREVVEWVLKAIPTHKQARHVVLDVWVIMPNHIHLILWLRTWPQNIVTQPEKREGFANVQSGSVGAIVGNCKRQMSRRINNLCRQPGGRVWQKGYWDRIIRNEDELMRTRQYIADNPRRWQKDRDNLDELLTKMVYHES